MNKPEINRPVQLVSQKRVSDVKQRRKPSLDHLLKKLDVSGHNMMDSLINHRHLNNASATQYHWL